MANAFLPLPARKFPEEAELLLEFKKKSPMCIVSLEVPKCDLCFPLFHITISISNQMKFSSICQSAKMMETHIL